MLRRAKNRPKTILKDKFYVVRHKTLLRAGLMWSVYDSEEEAVDILGRISYRLNPKFYTVISGREAKEMGLKFIGVSRRKGYSEPLWVHELSMHKPSVYTRRYQHKKKKLATINKK